MVLQERASQFAKVFWFFFSKKNYFLFAACPGLTLDTPPAAAVTRQVACAVMQLRPAWSDTQRSVPPAVTAPLNM
jgi:hypothetical protein